jgi:hypothetical protein
MLKKEDIKNGTIVYDDKKYYCIENVGNARIKGDRGNSSTPDEEVSYSIVDIITNEVHEGICEYSHMTSNLLSVASLKDMEIYLLHHEADASKSLAKAKAHYELVKKAMANKDKKQKDMLFSFISWYASKFEMTFTKEYKNKLIEEFKKTL